jgi:hypothetical protein
MWPDPDGFYEARADHPPVRPHRPLFQGDVFLDVPFSVSKRKAQHGAYHESSPTAVLLIGHPCVMHAGAKVLPVQSAVQVRLVADAVTEGKTFSPPYEGRYTLFPLPALRADGDYVADFRRIGTTPTLELDGRRVACLSKRAWVALQHRYVYHATRYELDFDLMFAQADHWWNDVMLWEEWRERGLRAEDYEAWVKQPLAGGSYAGTVRRAAAAFAPDAVRNEFPDPP